MKSWMFRLISAFLLIVMVSACAPATTTPAMAEESGMEEATMMPEATHSTMDEMMDETPTEDMMMETHPAMDETSAADDMMHETPAMEDEMMETPAADDMMEMPAWVDAVLTNVSSGETLKVSDFKGKVVLVETMAQWCPTCLSQQKNVKELHSRLGMPDNLVSLSLDIDPNEDAATLKQYAADKGFDWAFAVASPEVAREIGQLYGDQFLNPPSAPMLIVDHDGHVHPLPFGLKSVDDLQKAVEPFLNESM